MSLIGKRILFFTPKFLDYDKIIKDELERRGAIVSLYDERPSSNSMIKALIRVNPRFFEAFSRKYFSRIIAKHSEQDFDFIFIIKGEAISSSIIKLMKKNFNNSKLLFYSWDSFKNVKHTDTKLHLFDKLFSFDRNDCKNHQNINYLPLFFSPFYSALDHNNCHKKHDFIFIASLHSDRYDVLHRILSKTSIIEPNLTCYSFLFYSSKFFFLLRKLFDKNFKNIPYNNVSWTSLSQAEVVRKINEANIVIDINHPNQSGLTMRTIESIALKKKLITTNASIKHESFYNKANILIIDRNTPIISRDFIFSSYKEIDETIIDGYSIREWISNIFGEES